MKKRFITLIAMIGLLQGSFAWGAESRSPFAGFRDLKLTILARRAIQRDKDLARLNLGVKVQNGVATLWGPIPSEEAGRRAITQLMVVEGIFKVRADFQLKPVKPLLKLNDAPVITRTDTAKPLVRASPIQDQTSRPGELPSLDALPAPPKVDISPVKARPNPVSPPVARITLAQAVEKVRGSDPRYRLIEVQVHGTTVTVRAAEGVPEDATLLAQVLSRLDGVGEVVLKTE